MVNAMKAAKDAILCHVAKENFHHFSNPTRTGMLYVIHYDNELLCHVRRIPDSLRFALGKD